ncbi:hypothetical protein [Dietzia timorensis]|uniref:Uncharacterized protein n=1 Tax=Dietzia timorensis TaxID=499555 RepID=A0A173LIJ6_9ACTN|nr:hypothetical protein [Dietzia timorensis]ANI91261.1 Hypothetical protein BJL86_0454 [Dietzia timorensis]
MRTISNSGWVLPAGASGARTECADTPGALGRVVPSLFFSAPNDDAERSDTPAREWTAATWFIGTLLYAPFDLASAVLALLVPSDFLDPRAGLVVELAKRAVRDKRAPDPAAIMAYGFESGASASKSRARGLVAYMQEPFDKGLMPLALPHYAADVLREREREAYRELAGIAELAASASMDDLRAARDEWLERSRDRARRCAALSQL